MFGYRAYAFDFETLSVPVISGHENTLYFDHLYFTYCIEGGRGRNRNTEE